MSLSKVPLPSIALVLTTDHVLIPRRPSVIKLGVDTSPVLLSRPPDYLMKTVDLRDVDPSEYEAIPYNIRSKPAIIADDTMDYEGGSSHEDVLANAMKNKISRVLSTLRRFLPVKIAETYLRKVTRH